MPSSVGRYWGKLGPGGQMGCTQILALPLLSSIYPAKSRTLSEPQRSSYQGAKAGTCLKGLLGGLNKTVSKTPSLASDTAHRHKKRLIVPNIPFFKTEKNPTPRLLRARRRARPSLNRSCPQVRPLAFEDQVWTCSVGIQGGWGGEMLPAAAEAAWSAGRGREIIYVS